MRLYKGYYLIRVFFLFYFPQGKDDCQFDGQSWCFWQNDKTNPTYYTWKRVKGSTPSGGTGPAGDHTSGNGMFLNYSIYNKGASDLSLEKYKQTIL